MSDEQQPRAEWIFPEKKKSNKGRIWLIIGLSVLAVTLVAALLFFFLPRGGEATPSPTPSATKTQTPTPTPTLTATPTTGPITTPPPVPDPDMPTFVGQVQPWLDDASTGLTMVASMSGQEAAQVVDTLQGDAERLSGAVAPSSISSTWYPAVGEYASRLGELRSALESGSDPQNALDAATSALQHVRMLVGL